jgi:bifunctional DNase/RNase
MIEVTVHDVILRVLQGETIQWLGGARANKQFGLMALVVLKEHARERSLPIWVGVAEGNALALALAAVAPPRPMTHDLMARLVEVCQSQVEKWR